MIKDVLTIHFLGIMLNSKVFNIGIRSRYVKNDRNIQLTLFKMPLFSIGTISKSRGHLQLDERVQSHIPRLKCTLVLPDLVGKLLRVKKPFNYFLTIDIDGSLLCSKAVTALTHTKIIRQRGFIFH